MRFNRGNEGGMGAAKAHGYAKSLGAAHGNVCTPRSGGGEHGERKRIARSHKERSDIMHPLGKVAVTLDAPIRGRVLHERAAEILGRREGRWVSNLDPHTKPLGASFDDCERLRMTILRDEKGQSGVVCRRDAHVHRFGCGGALIEQRGSGDGQSREIADHRLKVQQRLKASLCHLGLIRRVCGVPRGVFKNVSLNHSRYERVHIAHADI